MNRDGHPQTLVAAHPGNRNAERHGLYSPRTLARRAREIADALMELPHVQPLDVLAAEEIGSVIAAVRVAGTRPDLRLSVERRLGVLTERHAAGDDPPFAAGRGGCR